MPWVNAGQIRGPQGPPGTNGAPGATGPAGPPTIPHIGETAPPDPATGMLWVDPAAEGGGGPPGPQGPAGPTGAQGPQGPQGPPGTNGAPGATGPAGPPTIPHIGETAPPDPTPGMLWIDLGGGNGGNGNGGNGGNGPTLTDWPDETNTGATLPPSLAPVGAANPVSGSGWTWGGNNSIHITGAGVTVSGLDVDGGCYIRESGVTLEGCFIHGQIFILSECEHSTIRNCEIAIPSDSTGVVPARSHYTTIEDCTMYSADPMGETDTPGLLRAAYCIVPGPEDPELIIRRCNLSGAQIQVGMGFEETGAITIIDNYMHDPRNRAGDHNNAMTGGNATIQVHAEHNTLLNWNVQSGAWSIGNSHQATANVTCKNNLLAGGGYALYAGSRSGQPPATNMTFTGNRWSTRYFPNGGFYGPVTQWDPGGGTNIWSDNRWEDGPNAGQEIMPA